MNPFWRDAWVSLKSATAGIPVVAGIGLALLGPLWNPALLVTVRVIWMVAFVLVGVGVVLALGDMMLKARRMAQAHPPKVIHVIAPEAMNAEAAAR